jgi:L-threonylcarbamoyladenylate synthase
VVKKINELTRQKEEAGFSVGIIATEEMKNLYNCKNIKVVGSREDEKSIAHNLFAILREFDKEDVQFIYSEGFSTDNVGQAVMNRLIKAAGHTIIKA